MIVLNKRPIYGLTPEGTNKIWYYHVLGKIQNKPRKVLLKKKGYNKFTRRNNNLCSSKPFKQ